MIDLEELIRAVRRGIERSNPEPTLQAMRARPYVLVELEDGARMEFYPRKIEVKAIPRHGERPHMYKATGEEKSGDYVAVEIRLDVEKSK